MTVGESTFVVEEFYDQWNSGAIDFERLVHPRIANHQPEREAEVGREAFRKAVEGVMGAVPDSRWTLLKLVTSGDLVVCHIEWSGTWGGLNLPRRRHSVRQALLRRAHPHLPD